MRLEDRLREKVKVISETELYGRACSFVDGYVREKNKPVKVSQVSGLEQVALNTDSLGTVERFINKQREKDRYREFYMRLNTELQGIRNMVVKGGLVGDYLGSEAENAPRKRFNEVRDFFALLLFREYVLHLGSHMRYKGETD